ncbi:MAG TPA: hypothetical protein VFV24_11120, partial [Candidatus Eisenbacteria bacterium]|nr:hypothetical protein [Candidatus Eisenbacteria bacterium]
MTSRAAIALSIAALVLSSSVLPSRAAAGTPKSTLSVWQDGAWRPFWHSDSAPAAWTAAHPLVESALQWKRL